MSSNNISTTGVDPETLSLEQDSQDSTKSLSNTILNPRVYMKQIYEQCTNLWNTLTSTIKFELPASQKKLTLNCFNMTVNGIFTVDWILYREVTRGLKREKVYRQQYIPCARYNAQSKPEEIQIVLKNKPGTDLVQDVISGFASQGINCEKIKLTPEEQKLQEEQNRQLAKVEKLRQEEEQARQLLEAERRQLPKIRKAPSWEEQDKYLSNSYVILGDIKLKDLLQDVEDDAAEVKEEAKAGSAEAQPAEDPKEMWSKRGKATYLSDNIWAQTVLFYQNVVDYFESIRPVYNANTKETEIDHVLWVVNDIEYDFETAFDVISSAANPAVMLQCFPVSTNSTTTMRVRSIKTKTFVKVFHPENFSMIGHMAVKDEGKFLFHKTLLASNEDTAEFTFFIQDADANFVDSLAKGLSAFRSNSNTQQQQDENYARYVKTLRKNALHAAQQMQAQTVNQAGPAENLHVYQTADEQDLYDVDTAEDPDGLFA